MHFQVDAAVGPKLLTVSNGAIIDFSVDIRPKSATYGVAFTAFVRAVEPTVLKIPSGFAHGYQTWEMNTTLLYWLDDEVESGQPLGYNPLSACMRDLWPIKKGLTISEKDLNSPEFEIDNLHVQEILAKVT
jgi:dTDP-4-dehydrorhamnose 3,5-epimerase